jgi:peptidoglycan/xylan/chitin deacetylase (PgdA/CDA1 family)
MFARGWPAVRVVPAVAGGVTVVAAALGWAARRQPRALARALARRSRRMLFAAPTSRPAVALTYDDGPDPALTPALLAVLRRHGARATFFLLGARVAERPDLASAVVAGGHEVGNHTWADRPSILLPVRDLEWDVVRTHRQLVAAGGAPVFLRPGSGWVRPGMLRVAARHGYRVILGSVAVLDLRVTDVEAQARFVLSRLQPGAVVVLHEGRADRAGVVPLTERVLTGLAARGYDAVTLSELFARPVEISRWPGG